MGTTSPPVAPAVTEPVPAPVVEVEQKVEDAAPNAIKPEVEQAEAAFNAFADSAEKDGAAAGPALEAAAPEDTKLAKDIEHKDVAAVVADAPAFTKAVKAGYKTTEFWLTLAGVVLTQLGTLTVPGKYGKTIQDTALIAAYAISRGLAK